MIGWVVRGLGRAAIWAYFRRIDAEGVRHVPASGALLIASNHVNALVDPMVIQYVVPRRFLITAKASLMKNPYVAFLLRAVGVVLFHRPSESGPQRAGAANREAFETCREHLARGRALCMFPEGKSHSEPAMLPFKQGLARIAVGYDGPLAIVPVGLYYEHKEQFRSAVSVRFGPPIEAHDHPEDAPALTREIRRRIEALTVQWRRPREVVLLEWVGQLLASRGAPPSSLRDEAPVTEQVERLQRIAAGYEQLREASDEEVAVLEKRVRAYRKELRDLGVSPAEVHLPMRWGRALHFVLSELEILVVGGAIAGLGWLNNILPFLVVRALARRLSKERDQWASNAIYPALAVYPFFYVVQTLLAWVFLSVPWAIAYTLLLPFSGAYYVLWRDRVGGAWRRARTFLHWRRHKDLQARLAEEGRSITQDILALAEAAEG